MIQWSNLSDIEYTYLPGLTAQIIESEGAYRIQVNHGNQTVYRQYYGKEFTLEQLKAKAAYELRIALINILRSLESELINLQQHKET